jgi:2-polyprenyl-3-methyl-5-hydroxy-6-metoxy-1,4-benzoquinol methylase
MALSSHGEFKTMADSTADTTADTTYAAKTGNYFENTRPEMQVHIPASARRMLEVGCGNAAFAASVKSSRPMHVTAIEGYAPAAEAAQPRVDRLLSMPLEEALPLLAGEQFDCIVMNDVLEHLVDPWAALTQLRPLLSPGGVVVASIPNIRYFHVFKEYLLEGQWKYQRDGVMDRTHLRFFTRKSMVDLFQDSGYTMQSIAGINGMAEFPFKFAVLNWLMGGSLDDARFIQFACVARAKA